MVRQPPTARGSAVVPRKGPRKRSLARLCCLFVMGAAQAGCANDSDQSASAADQSMSGIAPQGLSLVSEQPQQADQSPPPEQSQQLDQLVAPIALYPDALIAQMLAASTFPTEIVEAERWMQGHASLKGDPLAQEVDKQPWDSSVKALTQFPAVLANMDKNLSWTSALGDAYANQPQDVLNAVQVMRQRAQQVGNLKSTPQQTPTSFTCRNTILGSCTALQWWNIQAGCPIRGSSLLGRGSAWVWALASWPGMAGDGTTGAPTGTTTGSTSIIIPTSLGAERSSAAPTDFMVAHSTASRRRMIGSASVPAHSAGSIMAASPGPTHSAAGRVSAASMAASPEVFMAAAFTVVAAMVAAEVIDNAPPSLSA
jgi:hypothetical protein